VRSGESWFRRAVAIGTREAVMSQDCPAPRLGPLPVTSETLTDRTTRAARWRFTGSAIAAVSQLAVGAVLARLLTPADFGLVALAFVVLGFARPLADLGIGGAVVQRAGLSDRHVRTAFTFSVLLGLAIAGGMAALAPLGAAAMRNPLVTAVLRVLSVGFAVGGTGAVAGALLRRRLDFRRQFYIDTGSYVLGYGGVTIVLAVLGYGVWSLVWGGLCQGLLAAGGQLACVRHSIRPLLGQRELGELLHFGVGTSASACVNYLALNGDNFVVGRSVGAASLGLYNRAYTLMNLPFTYAASVMSSVLFPAFAQVQGEPERLRRGYLMMTELTAMLAAPAMGTLAVVAPHLVVTLYGSQWTGVVVPLQIFSLAGYFRALYHLGGTVAQSVGRVYGELWRQAVYAGLVIAGALVGMPYGLAGVATGVSVAILYMFAAMAHLSLRATGTSWRLYFHAQMSGLITGAVVTLAAFIVRLLLERYHAPSPMIVLFVGGGAAVPWSGGMLWTLGEPDFEPLRRSLPHPCLRVIERLRAQRGSSRH
jgi:O-antigen/teichoic acid export membrane protein